MLKQAFEKIGGMEVISTTGWAGLPPKIVSHGVSTGTHINPGLRNDDICEFA